MAIYKLHKMNQDGTALHPSSTSYTDKYAEENLDLYLRSKLVQNEAGKFSNVYRLHAGKPHTIEMALAYDIGCPECGKTLKQVGRCMDTHKLGLYRCPNCDRNKGGR